MCAADVTQPSPPKFQVHGEEDADCRVDNDVRTLTETITDERNTGVTLVPVFFPDKRRFDELA